MRSQLHKMWVASNFRRAAAVTTTSVHMRDTLIDEFGVDPDKIHTFSWGIGSSFFEKFHEAELAMLRDHLRVPHGRTYILSPRRLAPLYGTDIIIEAFSMIAERFPDAHLLLMNGADDKSFPDKMNRLSRDLSLEKRISFLPKLPSDRDVAKLFAMSDLFVSLPESDQLASTILEGMACGSIPVMADLKPYHEIVEDGVNGFYVHQRDAAGLAATLDYVLSELPFMAESIRERNRAYCESHERWESCAEKMHDLYFQVVGTKVN
jgi:glycosyltransferase involved in cell wall biosynthesis